MNILIAEDDTTSRLILLATLRKLGHTVTAVSDGGQALTAWLNGEFDLLISDWVMPVLDGLELCRRIRAEPRQKYTYIILLTALAGRGNYLGGMEAGADDFLLKPVDEDLLVARLHVASRIMELHESLRTQAMYDGLTGLWNRNTVLERLQQELNRAERENGSIGLIMADLDHFKQVNDKHGHLAGDMVLREAARRMQVSLRSYDRIGRYGGEEFLVVVPGCTLEQTRVVAEKMRASVEEMPIITPDGELHVTLSLGVGRQRRTWGETAAALISSADAALYRAKTGGRNRVEGPSEEELSDGIPGQAA